MFRAVAVSQITSCAIATDDALWCWGYNALGSVGNGGGADVLAPVRIGAAQWRDVSTGREYDNCGVQQNGTLWCWGQNFASSPISTAPGTGWQDVELGQRLNIPIEPYAEFSQAWLEAVAQVRKLG